MIKLISLVVLLSLAGCSQVDVKPWEKGYLAKQSMIFDSDALETLYLEHTYSSKESAAGGSSVGGGGCGCN